MAARAILDDADALAEGSAFAVLEGWRRTDVTGADAVAWLHDLLTAEIAPLAPGHARRSLLLSPTGRVRADVWVLRTTSGAALLEPADVADPIGALLAPYTLSSDVELSDPVATTVFAVPSVRGAGVLDDAASLAVSRPSLLGPGIDVIADAATAPLADDILRRHLRQADAGAAEVRRIARGTPRWNVDILPGDLPIGLGIDDAVADAKGCYLGQEAVAKIRNLGHPPIVLRHLTTHGPVHVGDQLGASGRSVGAVTSAAATRDGVVVLARVRWDAATEPLTLPDGTPFADAIGPRPVG